MQQVGRYSLNKICYISVLYCTSYSTIVPFLKWENLRHVWIIFSTHCLVPYNHLRHTGPMVANGMISWFGKIGARIYSLRHQWRAPIEATFEGISLTHQSYSTYQQPDGLKIENGLVYGKLDQLSKLLPTHLSTGMTSCHNGPLLHSFWAPGSSVSDNWCSALWIVWGAPALIACCTNL